MSKTRLISTLATGLGILAVACWMVTGAFPLTAQPQIVNDAPGVTVNLGGATLLHRTGVNYPTAAMRAGVQGNVSLEVRTDGSGNVIEARVLSGPDELRKASQESVLQWHFGRDAVSTTRVVQIGFEVPKLPSGVLGGIIGPIPAATSSGVAGGVSNGVTRGVVGGVPAGATVTDDRSGVFRTVTPQALPTHISSIEVRGLTEQAKAELLATLPVHEGDELTPEAMQRATLAARSFDEHLTVQRMFSGSATGTQMGLMISFAGAQVGSVAPPPQPATFSTSTSGPRVRVGGAEQAATIVSKTQPNYPALAKQARVSGVVHLAAVIGADGRVQELHSLGGPALLIQAAMDAVKEWVYQPTATAVETTIDVNFTLNQ